MSSRIIFSALFTLCTVVFYAQPLEINDVSPMYNANAIINFDILKENEIRDSTDQVQLWELAQVAEIRILNTIPRFENVETETCEPVESPSFESEANSYQAGMFYYADKVNIVVKNGYTFHVGDYYSNDTKIITCLDGAEEGLQVFSVKGIILSESRNVSWMTSSFMHFYPNKSVYSTSSSQNYFYK